MDVEKNDDFCEKSDEKNEQNYLVDAVKTGNRKKMLIALRDKIAATIENSESGRDIAALSKQIREVTAELDEIKAQEKAKREKRKAAKKPPSKRDQLRVING